MTVVLWNQNLPVTTGAQPPLDLRAVPQIEIEYGGEGSNLWLDITNAWRKDTPIVVTYGIQGSDPLDRVASAGSLEWTMDNGTHGNPIGWTSPVGQNRWPSFRLNARIRFSVGRAGQPRTYKHLGRLAAATPEPGIHKSLKTYCTSLDWFDDIARMTIPDDVAYQDATSGQLVTALINQLPFAYQPPGSHQIALGEESFPWSFDGGSGQQMAVRERLNQICLSEPGYAYIRGTSTGMQFVYETNQDRALKASRCTFDDATLVDLVAPSSREDLYGRVRIHVFPTETIAALQSIWSLDSTQTLVHAGETLTTLFGPYRDEQTHDLVGATNQIPPVAPAPGQPGDYTMNSLEDGTGTDLTANFTVAAAFTGVGVRFTITNHGATDGYITRLVVRGQAIRRSEAIIDRAVANSAGVKTLDFDMPYQSNINSGQSVADYYTSIFAQPFARIDALRFCANRNAMLTGGITVFDAARTLEPGDRVTVSETVTGMSSVPFTINSVQLEIHGNGVMWCTWGLEQASASGSFWRLGVSQLGVDTVLGF